MNDPYRILGVSPGASDDEVKKAYREQVRKYHPDNYQNNPLSDLAEEKMKEVNEAYELIMQQRGGNGGGGGGAYARGAQSGAGNGGGGASAPVYQQARAAINYGNIAQAEQILSSVSTRGGEWHFLMGTITYRKGWLDEARQHFQIACNMEPGNMEYRQALNYMQQAGQVYRPMGSSVFGMDACDCCSAMMCANCLCGGCR